MRCRKTAEGSPWSVGADGIVVLRLGDAGTLWNDFVDSLVSSKRFADCRYCGGTFSRLSVNPTVPSLSVHWYVSAAAGSGRSSPRQSASASAPVKGMLERGVKGYSSLAFGGKTS